MTGCLTLLGPSGSCAGAPPFDAAQVVAEWAAYMDRDYLLRPGDRLSITVYAAPELTQEVRVQPNGQVNLLRTDTAIHAAGRSVEAFRREVQKHYLEHLRQAEVSVLVIEPAVSSVYVAGEVRLPGTIPYDQNLTLLKAVSAAGGTQITAKESDVIVARKDGREKNRTFRVNMSEIVFGKSPDFPLLPGDVVWVQTSAIADVGIWVELYIRRLIPIPIGFAWPVGGGN